jgi:hypothetical protein
MKYLIAAVFSLFSFYAGAQNKASFNPKTTTLHQTIKGRWQAEDDKSLVIVFNDDGYTELYGKDTTENLKYTFSSSCKLSDPVKPTFYTLEKNKALNLLLFQKRKVRRCYELLNITKNTLSWMDNANGKIFVFRRM